MFWLETWGAFIPEIDFSNTRASSHLYQFYRFTRAYLIALNVLVMPDDIAPDTRTRAPT